MAFRRSPLSIVAVSLSVLVVSCEDRPPTPDQGIPDERDSSVPPGAPPLALPDDPFRLRNLGKLHAERDTEEGYRHAVLYLRRLVERQEGTATDRLSLAKALLFSAQLDDCEKFLAEARKGFGTQRAPADLDYVAGLLAKRGRRFEEAARHFARVIEKRPGHLHALFQLGYMQEELQRFEEAEKSFRRVLVGHPEHRASTYRLAVVLRNLKKQDEAAAMLERFRSFPKSKGGDGEKCDLTAVTMRPGDRASSEPPRVSLSWRDVTASVLASATGVEKGVSRSRPLGLGPEGSRGLLLFGPAGLKLLRLASNGPEEVRDALPASSMGTIQDVVAADFDNDGADDIVVLAGEEPRFLRGLGDGTFEALDVPGLKPARGLPRRAAAFDADHDGDLDIIITASTGGTTLLRNNGDLSFEELEPFRELEVVPGESVDLEAHDVDQANDIDFVFATGNGDLQAFLNRRDGTFTRFVLSGFGKRSRLLVEDLDNDGAPDFFATGGEPGWAYARNADPLGDPYRVRCRKPIETVDAPRCGEVRDACLADVDNDGDVDIVLATSSGVTVLRNVEGGTLREEDSVALAAGEGAAVVSVADLDCDGSLEVLVGTDSGNLRILASEATPDYAAITLFPRGGRDNFNAIGTVVEQYAGRLYQSRMLRDAGGLHLGLGGTDREGGIDGLRLRWPQGILQAVPSNAIEISSCGRFGLRQREGLVASCPFLYARGKRGWQFITDVLGIAPLDEWLPSGAQPHLDPEEFVRIDGDELAARDGVIELAITEELRETAYLDRLELLVVEHPAEVSVYIDESTRQASYEELVVYVLSKRDGSPPAAVVTNGEDCRAAVVARDGVYVHGYRETRSQWAGWVEPYDLELTTASPARLLLLTGRIAWYDSTVVFALAQHGRGWRPLRLEHLGPDGRWEILLGDLGFPAGMDRTVAVQLPRALPAGARLRLTAEHRFLWDRMQLAATYESLALPRDGSYRAGGTELVRRRCPLIRAELGFHGFSKTVGKRARHEQTYAYDETAPDDVFAPSTGRATRYGEVSDLIGEHDDRLAVLVAGDGLVASFEAPPPLQAGRRRTFFLRVSGWAKEASFHNSSGGTIEPLPLRAMSRYPPSSGETRTEDEAYQSYLETYQTRRVRRRAP